MNNTINLGPEEQEILRRLTEEAVHPEELIRTLENTSEPILEIPNSPWDMVVPVPGCNPGVSEEILESASGGFNTVTEPTNEPSEDHEETHDTHDNPAADIVNSINAFNEALEAYYQTTGASIDSEGIETSEASLEHEATFTETHEEALLSSEDSIEDAPFEVSTETAQAPIEGLESVIEELESVNPGDTSIDPVVPNMENAFTENNTARFSSAIWYENIRKKVIILAGVGGIGSWVALLLGKLQPASIFMYDNDFVESVNMAGQLYSTQDVGKSKVDALANTIRKYAAYEGAFAVRQLYEEDCEPADIMICGFDNMRARKTFYRRWLSHINGKTPEQKKHCLFIDGRLAAEELQVFCFTGDNNFGITQYETHYLFTDYQAESTICSYKQTAFMANMIAGVIVNLLVNFAANECNPPMPRSLPFKTLYNATMMFFSTMEV